jgi:hypothetical protein
MGWEAKDNIPNGLSPKMKPFTSFIKFYFSVIGLKWMVATSVLIPFCCVFSESALGQTSETSTIPDSGKEYQLGCAQVKRMLNDRIFMSAYPSGQHGMKMVTEEDAIFIWLAKQFAPKPDFIILWNSDPPRAPAMSDNIPPGDKRIGYIRLRDVDLDGAGRGNYRSFEQLWSLTIYECFSLQMAPRWNELYQRAAVKKITRIDFIASAARIEFDASLKTREFYYTVWSSWAKSANFQPDSRLWDAINTPDSFQEWISRYKIRGDKYPEEPYGGYYDNLTGVASGNDNKQNP